MTEDQLEQETLGWLADVGYASIFGPDIALDGNAPERTNYQQVVLIERLRQALQKLNPAIPAPAREDALRQILDLGIPALATFPNVDLALRDESGSEALNANNLTDKEYVTACDYYCWYGNRRNVIASVSYEF